MNTNALLSALLLSVCPLSAYAHDNPRFLDALEGSRPPDGYREGTRPRIALVTTGASLFLAGWGIASASGATFFCELKRPACTGSPLVGLIPIAGGMLMANQHYLPAWAGSLVTLAQSFGAILAVVGIALPERVWVLEEVQLHLTATGVSGTF